MNKAPTDGLGFVQRSQTGKTQGNAQAVSCGNTAAMVDMDPFCY